MRFILVILFSVLTGTCYASQHEFCLQNVLIDDENCTKDGNTFYKDNLKFSLDSGPLEKNQLPITFTWKNDDGQGTETLMASVEKTLSPVRLPTMTYNKNQTLDEFVQKLNESNFPGIETLTCTFEDGLNEGEWSPTVILSTIYQITFGKWEIEHDKKNNQSVIYAPYGKNGEDFLGKFNFHSFKHKAHLKKRDGVYFLDKQRGAVKEVLNVEWDVFGDQSGEWLKNNKLENQKYEGVEHSHSIGFCSEQAPLLTYFKEVSHQQAPCSYVYWTGTGMRLAQINKWFVIPLGDKLEEIKGDEQTISLLQPTSIPVFSPEKTTENGHFQKGYYSVLSENDVKETTLQTWQEFNGVSSVGTATPGTRGAFSTVDVTGLLLTNDYGQVFAEIVEHFKPWKNEGKLTFHLNLENKEKSEKIKATKRFIELLEKFPESLFEVRGLSFEEATLTKPILKYFLKNKDFYKDRFPNGILPKEIKLKLNNFPLPWGVHDSPKFYPEILDLSGSNLHCKVGSLIQHVKENERLKSFNLKSIKGDISNEEKLSLLQAIIQNKKLTKFVYWGDAFSIAVPGTKELSLSEKLSLISKLHGLKRLNLAKLDVEEGTELLRCLKNNEQTLTYLDLAETKNLYNTKGQLAKTISKMTDLEEVDLLKGELSNGQILKLACALKDFKALKKLKISLPYSPVDIDGTTIYAKHFIDSAIDNPLTTTVFGGICLFCPPIGATALALYLTGQVVMTGTDVITNLVGIPNDNARWTLYYISQIENLEKARISVSGFIQYHKLMLSYIDEERTKCKLNKAEIDFIN